ncbi:MAG: hypothetical protein JRJ42_02125 [Deltaproteobacteria bacterium]|nr:hypothetical protein [Deltaproteobacteria bacterium]MBW2018907.1 hypothetical protein [Deltaproteobacteria bacterium]MBW2073662.1 hypothetical protein [Deltaproteobacteria bacterium]RLB81171.1 MAG: hypothetical protein DRH17_09935 [Deltaproteobacteria bacterium]
MERNQLFLFVFLFVFTAIILLFGCTPFKKKTHLNIPSKAKNVVLLAKKDLSARLKVPITSISIIRIEAINWSNTSLGFPREGMIYAQVITPGYKIILSAQGKHYEYHSDYDRVITQD